MQRNIWFRLLFSGLRINSGFLISWTIIKNLLNSVLRILSNQKSPALSIKSPLKAWLDFTS